MRTKNEISLQKNLLCASKYMALRINVITLYSTTYKCAHPIYSTCTLFKINDKGLAVVQQRYCQKTKTTYWNSIDPWLVDDLYLHKNCDMFCNERAGECTDGVYPTVTIMQIMWGLRMKPLSRERWETCFDRKLI